MIALDTCVLARLLIGDDPRQQKIAEQLVADQECSVSWSVLVELCWVLERSAQLPRGQVIQVFEMILEIENLAVQDDALLAWAIQRYSAGADFPDMVHLASTVAGSTAFATFDKPLARQAGSNPPLPVQCL